MIKRNWAWIIGIIFTISSIYQLTTDAATVSKNPTAYYNGKLTALILLPILFLVIAFLSKNKNKKK